MKDPTPARLHAFVEGTVQGVGFRAFVLQNAEDMDLTGWVRNTSLGEVEVVAEGERGVLENFRSYLQRGPGSAFVTELRQEWSAPSGEFTEFRVRRTE